MVVSEYQLPITVMPDLHNNEPELIPSVSPATSPLSPPNTPETIVDSPPQAQPQTLNVTPSQTRPSTPTMLTSPVKPLLPSMSITSLEPLEPLLPNPWRNAGVPPKEWWSIWEPGKSKVTATNQDSSHIEETDQMTSGNRGDDMENNDRTIPTALSMQYTDPQSFREAIA